MHTEADCLLAFMDTSKTYGTPSFLTNIRCGEWNTINSGIQRRGGLRWPQLKTNTTHRDGNGHTETRQRRCSRGGGSHRWDHYVWIAMG